ncbi:ATP-binding protein [Malonomonas rubra]|uniref:PAS domain-containing sensor histidine kinase n=1 Tax=Malonomonas rubra TaxID=57040 RepID=UPI0026EAF382|nr:ATP-binding protein [Malonomonas rubra]
MIFLLLFFSFIQIRSNIQQLTGVEMRKIVEGSRIALDLGQFLARLKVLQATFYRNDEFLQEEGAYLLKMVQQFEGDYTDSFSPATQASLREQLGGLLEQCTKVNDSLEQLQQLNGEFSRLLEEVDRQIEEQTRRTLAVTEVTKLEQLTHLLAHYRIELVETIHVHDQPGQWQQPSNNEIVSLQARLQALSAEQGPIDFVPQLLSLMQRYRVLRETHYQAMNLLGKHSTALNQTAQEGLQQIGKVDWLIEQHAEQVMTEIDSTVMTTEVMVMGLITVFALLLALIQIQLYRKHIKRPMEHVRKRLLAVQRGNYSSPMQMGRLDEWGQIESIFNILLNDLINNWSALQESEKRYRNFFDCAAEGIFQSTQKGVLLNMNPSMIEMFGFDDHEANKQVESIYADPADWLRLLTLLQKEDIVSNYEVEMRRSNGQTFWAVINSHLVRDAEESIQLVEGTVEDISMRRAGDEALRQLKEYLHAIVDTMPSILIGIDEKRRVTLWNRAVAELSGIPEEQAFGEQLEEVFSLIDQSYYLNHIDETLNSKEVVRLGKIPGAKVCEGCYFDMLIYPLLSLEITGAVIYMDDITEKLRIEEVMVQSEKMLSVGSLAAGMAHEINNPLASILQNVQVLGQRLSPALKKNQEVALQLGIQVEQVAEYARMRGFDQMIKSIAESGQRAARIIENMLNFSRKSASHFLPCSLAELVEKTIELASSDYDMKHQFDFRKINIVREFRPVPDVPCESSQIQQVVLSLLKNAAEALMDSEGPEITVRIFQEEEQVCVQIADNGEGMPEPVRRRIFEPFFTTKEVGLGTGLGLSVSYFLVVQNHKGRLTVDSQPGEGTCFSFFLPLALEK